MTCSQEDLLLPTSVSLFTYSSRFSFTLRLFSNLMCLCIVILEDCDLYHRLSSSSVFLFKLLILHFFHSQVASRVRAGFAGARVLARLNDWPECWEENSSGGGDDWHKTRIYIFFNFSIAFECCNCYIPNKSYSDSSLVWLKTGIAVSLNSMQSNRMPLKNKRKAEAHSILFASSNCSNWLILPHF